MEKVKMRDPSSSFRMVGYRKQFDALVRNNDDDTARLNNNIVNDIIIHAAHGGSQSGSEREK